MQEVVNGNVRLCEKARLALIFTMQDQDILTSSVAALRLRSLLSAKLSWSGSKKFRHHSMIVKTSITLYETALREKSRLGDAHNGTTTKQDCKTHELPGKFCKIYAF